VRLHFFLNISEYARARVRVAKQIFGMHFLENP
jgi:hypothetical protein